MTAMNIRKSTIDRAKMISVRAFFRAGELVAPGVAARAAAQLWLRVPAAAADVAEPGGGVAFEVTVQGGVVRGVHWGDGPVVYLVHGWAGHSRQLAGLVEPVVASGHRVVAFDAPSHGRSDPGPLGPRHSHGVEFGRALDAVAARYGPAHAVVAHSLGAVVSLLALRHGWLSTERLALLAPMDDLGRYFDQFSSQLGVGPRTRRRLDAVIEARVGLPVAAFNLSRLAESAGWPSVLVVHDRRDRETAYDASVSVVDHWPGATLLSTEGLGHRRLLHDPNVIAAVASFVADAEARAA